MDFLNRFRWYNEYGKAYDLKEFRLYSPTTHASDFCDYASYSAYITDSNKILYLHEHFKAAVWRVVELMDPAGASPQFQIPFRPSSLLKLLHLTKMVRTFQSPSTSGTTSLMMRRCMRNLDPTQTLALFSLTTLLCQALRMLGLIVYGVAPQHFSRTIRCHPSSEIAASSVSTRAPDHIRPSSFSQLTRCSLALRS